MKGSLKRKPGAFSIMFNHNPEERIKRLEEEIAWMRRDMVNLITIIENMKPENHTHYTNIFLTKPCTDDPMDSTDLKDFI